MRRLSWLIPALVVALPSGAFAQLVPPSVERLPTVTLPAEVPSPDGGAVDVRVRIGTDGLAELLACEASEAVCAAVAEAVRAGTFEPATRDGVAIVSDVALRLRVAEVAPEVGPGPEVGPEVGPGPGPGPERGSGEPEREVHFGATAQIEVPAGAPTVLSLEEMRALPGTFGEPFRAIEAFPGVVPVLSGLPYVYVRGAPPSGTIYVYDEIPIPALFHLGLGPSVVHARMIGGVELYSGVPPARYGRLLGGAVVGDGPASAPPTRVEGELELRAFDLSGYARVPVGRDGSIAVAGRYGYPGLILSLVEPTVNLAYWDYQLRVDVATAGRSRFQFVWIGSFDSLEVEDEEDAGLRLQFHRLEGRYLHRFGRYEFGTAVRLGFDESGLGDELSVRSLRFGPRLWLRWSSGRTRLRVGADMTGIGGTIHTAGDFDEDGDITDPSDDPLFAAVKARSISGVHGELSFAPHRALTLELGARADLWMTGGQVAAAFDPRARLTWHAPAGVDVHVAAGLVHQPAVFVVPIPGLADVAVDRGLQRAIQAEVGMRTELPAGFELEVQGFLHRFQDLLFLDVFLDQSIACADEEGCDVDTESRTDGTSYGAELFLRRDPAEAVSGFVSYTLARATVDQTELEFTPAYDIRHVLNVALLLRAGGFSAGLRLSARSGRPAGRFYVDGLDISRYEQRLPWFVRVDAQLGYEWTRRWGRVRLMAEWLNVTRAREPTDIDCDPDPLIARPDRCAVDQGTAIWLPSLGVRATF